jgi:ribosomal protein S3
MSQVEAALEKLDELHSRVAPEPKDATEHLVREAIELAEEKIAREKPTAEVTNEDRLRVENLTLRAQLLISNRIELLRSQKETIDKVQEVDRVLGRTNQEIRKLQTELSEKYGVDFSKQQIDVNTGRVVPK